MRQTWFACIVLVIWPTLATGETYVVKSGEHAGFSRLFIDFHRATRWRLSPRGDGYELKVASADAEFDPSRVFRLIPRDRIAGLDPFPGGLTLSVSCDCHAEAFEVGPGQLVIDIHDGKPEDIEASFGTLPEEVAAESDPGPGSDTAIAPREADPITPDFAATLPITVLPRADDTLWRQNSTPPRLDGADPHIAAARRDLVEQLARGMSQGVIQFDPLEIPHLQSSRPDHPSEDNPPLPRDPVPDTPEISLLDHLNLRAVTTFDRDSTAAALARNAGGPDPHCLSDAALSLPDLPDNMVPAEAIADLRGDLTGELDRTDANKLDTLVRLYVFLGFGTEAAALVETFDLPGDHRQLLLEMAALLETGHAPADGLLASQTTCPGAAALWGAAAAAMPLGYRPDFSAMNRQMSELPLTLRRALVPLAGQRLIAAGFVQEARDLARIVARAPGEHGSQFRLFMAELELAEGRLTQGLAALEDLAMTNDPVADPALVRLIEAELDLGLPVARAMIDEAGARAFEMRNSAIGLALREAEIMARSQSGKPADALAVLAHEADIGALPIAEVHRIAAWVFRQFTPENLDIAEFLRAVAHGRALIGTGPQSDDARLHFANLLLAAGLWQQALKAVDIPPDRQGTDYLRVRARIALAASDPVLALDLLVDDDAAEATQLRAAAYRQLGQTDRALAELAAGDPTTGREDIAWQSGRFDLVSDNASTRANAARYMLGRPVIAAGQTGLRPFAIDESADLATLAEALGRSEADRNAIDTLLGEHPRPEPAAR